MSLCAYSSFVYGGIVARKALVSLPYQLLPRAWLAALATTLFALLLHLPTPIPIQPSPAGRSLPATFLLCVSLPAPADFPSLAVASEASFATLFETLQLATLRSLSDMRLSSGATVATLAC